MIYLTKSFVEHVWYRRPKGAAAQDFQEVPRTQSGQTSLDEQVKEWVNKTHNVIVHPGQPAIHKEWFEDNTLLCVTLAIVVLYAQPDEESHDDPGIEPFTATDEPVPEPASGSTHHDLPQL